MYLTNSIAACILVIAGIGSARAADFHAGVYDAYEQGMALGHQRQFADALRLLTEAAAEGYAEAQYAVGTMYSGGQGVTESKEIARGWFEKAAVQNHPMANYNLGIYYDNGVGVEADAQTALVYFRRAGELGVPEAAYNAGHMYLKGEGATTSVEDALYWFRMAADANLAEAQNAIGYGYLHGVGSPPDLTAARLWFERASAQGSRIAAENLREVAALSHQPALRDEREGRAAQAAEVYRFGCDQGYFWACLDDGRTAYHGIGRDRDYRRARISYGKACFEDIPDACQGHAYSVVQDPVSVDEVQRAAVWLRTACDAEDYHACHVLGYMHWGDAFAMYDIEEVKRLLVRACFDGGNQDSCDTVFGIMNEEAAMRNLSSEPSGSGGSSSGLGDFFLGGLEVVLGAMSAMGQAQPGASYGYSVQSGGMDPVALNNQRQDARDFNDFINRIDSYGGDYGSGCRPGNPYC